MHKSRRSHVKKPTMVCDTLFMKVDEFDIEGLMAHIFEFVSALGNDAMNWGEEGCCYDWWYFRTFGRFRGGHPKVGQ